jgi:hypothetical protein
MPRRRTTVKKPIVHEEPPVDVTMTEPKTRSEAVNFMFAGWKYFLLTRPIITILATAYCLLGPLIAGGFYFASDKVKVTIAEPKEAKPISNISIMPQAYAETTGGNPILIDGKLYGYYDDNFICYMVQGESKIFVYDKSSKRGWFIDGVYQVRAK